MSRLLIVAASGLAREVLAVLRETRRFGDVRLVDDDPRLWGTDVMGCPVVGGLDLVREYADHRLLVCAGQGTARRAIVARLTALGVGPDRYATLVHPSVALASGCTVGAGSVVLAGVVMTVGVDVGRHVVVMPHVTLTHDDRVEDFATLCAGVRLGGGVTVGSGAYLGMSSCVREGVSVGRDAVLGMGAALVCDLPPEETWVGVPAGPVPSRLEVER